MRNLCEYNFVALQDDGARVEAVSLFYPAGHGVPVVEQVVLVCYNRAPLLAVEAELL